MYSLECFHNSTVHPNEFWVWRSTHLQNLNFALRLWCFFLFFFYFKNAWSISLGETLLKIKPKKVSCFSINSALLMSIAIAFCIHVMTISLHRSQYSINWSFRSFGSQKVPSMKPSLFFYPQCPSHRTSPRVIVAGVQNMSDQHNNTSIIAVNIVGTTGMSWIMERTPQLLPLACSWFWLLFGLVFWERICISRIWFLHFCF